MFFYIGKDCPIRSMLPVSPEVYLDAGWSSTVVDSRPAWFKGYSTDCVLGNSISEILNGYKPAGKWCVIYDNKIAHPSMRGFPLFTDADTITNINLPGLNWTGYIPPTCTLLPDQITLDEAAHLIGDVLEENTRNFFKYNPVRMNMLFTCGLDSMTSWAVLDHYTKDYNLEIYVPKATDHSLTQRLGVVRNTTSDLIDSVSASYWGYNLTSTYTEENWYMTGFYSERIQLREADHISAIANFYGKNIRNISASTDYLHKFLQRPGTKKYLETTLQFADEKAVKDYCFNAVFNDHQMWHLDKNFHFSPFNDIRITEIAYRLSVEDLLKNGLNGLIQKEIVKRYRPDFLSLLSDFKIEGDIYGNFNANFRNAILDPRVHVKLR